MSDLVLQWFDTTIKRKPISALCIFGSQYIIGRLFCLSVTVTSKYEQYLRVDENAATKRTLTQSEKNSKNILNRKK